jgi:hypothetical protein
VQSAEQGATALGTKVERQKMGRGCHALELSPYAASVPQDTLIGGDRQRGLSPSRYVSQNRTRGPRHIRRA